MCAISIFLLLCFAPTQASHLRTQTHERTPPPPPPESDAGPNDEKSDDKPKKPWTKPTISVIDESLTLTESGAKAGPETESGVYRPMS